MTLQEIIGLAVNISLFLVVFSLGVDATLRDAVSLFRNPPQLVKSILSMNVIMLAFAVVAALVLDLPQPIEVALIALAASPVPPILPGKQKKAGGHTDYAIGLLCAASIIAILLVPLSIELVGRIFSREVHVPTVRLAQIVFMSILLPLAAGMLMRLIAPALANRIGRPAALAGMILLVVAVIPVAITAWPAFAAFMGDGILVALVAFTLIGTAVGHALGGPDESDRTVLALATGARHPAIAMAIAGAAGAEPKTMLALVLFHLLIATIVVLPYVRWRSALHGRGEIA